MWRHRIAVHRVDQTCLMFGLVLPASPAKPDGRPQGRPPPLASGECHAPQTPCYPVRCRRGHLALVHGGSGPDTGTARRCRLFHKPQGSGYGDKPVQSAVWTNRDGRCARRRREREDWTPSSPDRCQVVGRRGESAAADGRTTHAFWRRTDRDDADPFARQAHFATGARRLDARAVFAANRVTGHHSNGQATECGGAAGKLSPDGRDAARLTPSKKSTVAR